MSFMGDEKDKKITEKTGETVGKAARDVTEGTKSLFKGLKKDCFRPQNT